MLKFAIVAAAAIWAWTKLEPKSGWTGNDTSTSSGSGSGSSSPSWDLGTGYGSGGTFQPPVQLAAYTPSDLGSTTAATV